MQSKDYKANMQVNQPGANHVTITASCVSVKLTFGFSFDQLRLSMSFLESMTLRL